MANNCTGKTHCFSFTLTLIIVLTPDMREVFPTPTQAVGVLKQLTADRVSADLIG